MNPPLIENYVSGKSSFSFTTQSYFNGGTVRFCSGFNPFKNAFLRINHLKPCMNDKMINLTFANHRVYKFFNKFIAVKIINLKYYTIYYTPNLHLTVTGIDTVFFISKTHSDTKSASFIKHAPNAPC